MKSTLTISAVFFLSAVTSCSDVGTVDTSQADDLRSHKKDTVYITKTVYKTDTLYKTTTITKHDTLYKTITNTVIKHDTLYKINTVYKTDTIYKPTTIIKHDTLTVTKVQTVYKRDTIYNTIVKRDTITQVKTIRDTIRIHDTVRIDNAAAKTIFGVLNAEKSIAESETIMRESGVNVQRVAMFFSTTYFSKSADQYIKDGFNVQINFNYKPTPNPVAWCTDTAFIRKQAKLFFAYYKPYIKQIPLVAVENEWDNVLYHVGNIDDYLRELAIVVDEGHKAGFKVTDAAITSNALQRWNYSQLSTNCANWWKAHYFVGLQNDYTNYINNINYYASKVKGIPIDYINFHWYNNTACSNGLSSALYNWLTATGKSVSTTNEWGVKDTALWSCTVAEVLGVNPAHAIAYSGVNDPNNAALLTADMLKVLK